MPVSAKSNCGTPASPKGRSRRAASQWEPTRIRVGASFSPMSLTCHRRKAQIDMPSEVAGISLRGKSHHEDAYVGTWHPSSRTDEFVKSIMEHGCIRGFVERDEWRPHAHDGACPRCRIVRIAACRLPQCREAGIGDLFARRPVGSAWRICSTKPEVCAYNVLSPRIERREAAALRGEESNARLRHLAHNPEGESKPEKIFLFGFAVTP